MTKSQINLSEVTTCSYALQVVILSKSSEQEQQEYILHSVSCALKVLLKCALVAYLAIVTSSLLRSELLTTSE